MISLELWRARIGTFNNKCCSGCSLSSLLSSSFASSSDNCRHSGNVLQDKPPSSSKAQISFCSSLPVTPDEQLETDRQLGDVSISAFSSSSPCSSHDAFYSQTLSSSFRSSSSSYFPCDQMFLRRSLLRDAVITLLIAITSQLLMIAGDIETNPGPKHGADNKPGLDDLLCMSYTGEDGRDTRFRLMDQLQPHWRRLAVALKFRLCDINVMKQEDDPVFHLLSEWLRGANQERDSRPVTWATLITALRDANVQEEVDILEEHFVEIQLPVVSVTMSQAEGSQVPGKYFELINHPSGGYIMRHGPIQVFVKPDVPEKLRLLLKEYASMLMILRRSKLSEAKFSDLKLYLSGYCSLESIEQCTSLRAVVDLLIKHLKVYMFNIYTLNVSCKYFNDTIKLTVQKYRKCLNNFLKNTSVNKFKNTIKTQVVDRIGMDSITLKLDESRADDTLKALNMFLYRFFGNCSRALNHYDTGPGCVRITWLVSTSLVPTLRAMAEQHTLKYLFSQGILELVIGDLQIKVTNHQMYVHEWPHQYQSHLQLYALRDCLRKEFENFKKEFFEEKNDHEQLQNELKTTEKQQATTRKQHQELKHLRENLKQNEESSSVTSHDVQEYSSAELRSFKMHYTDLLMNIHNPAELSERLFAADLLSIHMIQAIRSLKKPVQQLVKLLDTVEIQISLDPLKFDTFVNELRPMQHLCDKLRSTCAQLMEPFDEVIPAILPTRTPRYPLSQDSRYLPAPSDYFSSSQSSSLESSLSPSPVHGPSLRPISSLAASMQEPLQSIEVETTEGTRTLHIQQLRLSQSKATTEIDIEVVVKRKDGTYTKGRLKYVGIPTGTKETMAGIALDLPRKDSDNDGQFKDGKRYFKCAKGHGLYTTPENVYAVMYK